MKEYNLMSITNQQPSDGESPEQPGYPDTNRLKDCPSPPETTTYPDFEIVAQGPVAVEREVALAGPQSFTLDETTTATVRTQISEYQELDSFLQNETTDTELVVWQLTAYPSEDHIKPVDCSDWEVEFRAPVATWRTVGRDIAANERLQSVSPSTIVRSLRRFVRSGLTDDHAVFALLDIVDEHDVDIDWDRNRMFECLGDG